MEEIIAGPMGVFAVYEELGYDAWGNLRNPYTWTGSFAGTPKFDHGFTGHEHHRYFGLINMNGRMYDPVTRITMVISFMMDTIILGLLFLAKQDTFIQMVRIHR